MALMLPSLDPIVSGLAVRWFALRREAEQIDSVLNAYTAGSASSAVRTLPLPMAPLDHATMLDTDDACGCAVCVEWARRREELARAMRLVPAGHRWSVCACPDCRFVGRLQLNYVATANLRDLMIEVAFHARHHSRHGEKIMEWFVNEVAGPRYTVAWCAYEIGRRPIDEWLDRCEQALSPVLSGAVFAMGEGKHDALEAWMPSQLGAADAYAPMEAAD